MGSILLPGIGVTFHPHDKHLVGLCLQHTDAVVHGLQAGHHKVAGHFLGNTSNFYTRTVSEQNTNSGYYIKHCEREIADMPMTYLKICDVMFSPDFVEEGSRDRRPETRIWRGNTPTPPIEMADEPMRYNQFVYGFDTEDFTDDPVPSNTDWLPYWWDYVRSCIQEHIVNVDATMQVQKILVDGVVNLPNKIYDELTPAQQIMLDSSRIRKRILNATTVDRAIKIEQIYSSDGGLDALATLHSRIVNLEKYLYKVST